MKRIIENSIRKAVLWGIFSLLINPTYAQQLEYSEIYPILPFDMAKSTAAGNSKTTVWYGTYTKSEGDESGIIWSNPLVESHQRQRYEYFEGKMQIMTTYLPNGDKKASEEYFYRDGLLSAIELLHYDSLQNPKQAGGWIYLYYKDGRPFQRVKTFGFPNKGVRLLDEFVFNEQKQVIKQKTTAAGRGPDMDSLLNGMKDREVRKVVNRYQDTIVRTQRFKSLYELQEESVTRYNDQKKPIQTIVTNTAGEIIVGIEYEYGDGVHCTQKTYWTEEQTEAGERIRGNYKVEYFTFEEDLISTHIIEEDGIQTVLEYTHFSE